MRRQWWAVLAAGEFDRVLGSVHSLANGDEYAEPTGLFEHREADVVLKEYLIEVASLAASPAPFQVRPASLTCTDARFGLFVPLAQSTH